MCAGACVCVCVCVCVSASKDDRCKHKKGKHLGCCWWKRERERDSFCSRRTKEQENNSKESKVSKGEARLVVARWW